MIVVRLLILGHIYNECKITLHNLYTEIMHFFLCLMNIQVSSFGNSFFIHFSYLIIDDFNDLNARNDIFLILILCGKISASNLALVFYLCFWCSLLNMFYKTLLILLIFSFCVFSIFLRSTFLSQWHKVSFLYFF